MAGWLKRDNGSSLKECSHTPLKAQETEVCSDLESEKNSDEKVKCLFHKFLKDFLKEVYGASCFRPLPPVIGEGQIVDLFKLQIVVRRRGGYSTVAKNGLWSSVVADCGLDLRIATALKLVYVKYLDTLDRWLGKIDKDKENLDFSSFLMDLDLDSDVFIAGIQGKIEEDEEYVEFKKRALGSVEDVGLNVDVKSVDEKCSNKNRGGNVNVDEEQCVDEDGNGDDMMIDEDTVTRKRKRECYMGLLNWIVNVAKDPCNPATEPLPERQKWTSYGTELPWKQILLVREAMLLKKNADAGSQQTIWQKKQKMHPSMYDDGQCGSEKLRCSQRLLSSKDSSRKAQAEPSSSSSPSDEDVGDKKQSDSTADSFLSNYRKKRIPIGPLYQADLPEFSEADYESDPKWSGTKIWPLHKAERTKSLIERDPIGKGRQESCGCQFPGSIECVRFHVREKRVKVKLELGSAFYMWKFDGTGEDVALSWTKEDENKFQHIVESNRLSSDKYFWDELFKFFPRKGREALVSYYFNVFLLRRRGHQNRSSTSNIDSDDEESEFGPIANRFGQLAGSIFCSPKKSHSNSR